LGEETMNIFEAHNQGLKAISEGDTFYEQWGSGTYIVAGVFQRPCHLLDVRQIQDKIPYLFGLLKKNKKGWWPKGICGYYAIPIYISDAFDQTVIEWVHSRPTYRYAMWHEPVLYNRVCNVAEMNKSWGLYCAAFRIFLFEVIFLALQGLSQKNGHTQFPFVNGQTVQIEKGTQPAISAHSATPRR
jgi:hypothetical protein